MLIKLQLIVGLAGVLDPDEHGALVGSNEYLGNLARLRADKTTADFAVCGWSEHLIVAESGVVAGTLRKLSSGARANPGQHLGPRTRRITAV
jgi:hypothetical protein